MPRQAVVSAMVGLRMVDGLRALEDPIPATAQVHIEAICNLRMIYLGSK